MPEKSTTTDHSAVLAFFGVAAVLALVLAFTAVVMAAGDDSGAGSVSTAAPTRYRSRNRSQCEHRGPLPDPLLRLRAAAIDAAPAG